MTSRGLRCLGLAVLVAVGVTGCSSSGSGAQSQNSPTGTDTAENSAALTTDAQNGSAAAPSARGGIPSVPVHVSGSGSRHSEPFLVNTSAVIVKYTYDCSSTGGSGFAADMISTGSLSLSGPDDQIIAKVHGAGGSGSTTVHPQNVGSDYYLQVNSECNWRIVVDKG